MEKADKLHQIGRALGEWSKTIVLKIFASMRERLSYTGKCWANESRLIRYIWTEYYPGTKWPAERKYSGRLSALEKTAMILLIWIRRFYQSFKAFICKTDEPDIADWYVPIELVLLLVLLFLPMLKPLFSVIVFLILIEVLNYPLCVVFVERYKGNWKPKSFNRSLILLFINYLQIIVGFAYLYLHTTPIHYSNCGKIVTAPLEALYFSTVTITTLGYGDMRPIYPFGRFLASVETIMGMILIVLVVGIFLIEMSNKLVKK